MDWETSSEKSETVGKRCDGLPGQWSLRGKFQDKTRGGQASFIGSDGLKRVSYQEKSGSAITQEILFSRFKDLDVSTQEGERPR